MSSNSPLLDKARKESIKQGFRIPRRGRLRVVLLIVIIGCGIWWYTTHNTSPDNKKSEIADKTKAEKQKPPKKVSEKTPNQISIKTPPQSPPATNRKKEKKKLEAKRPKKMIFENVCNILNSSPPRLTHSKDTIHFKDGSYIVHYSLDTTLQRLGEKYFKQYHPKYGAVTIIEPSTGRVLSLVSYTREDEVSLGRNLYCRSFFPAASIFKTIAAAAAIEKAGLRLTSKLRTFGANHTLYHSQLKRELKNYREVTFQEAYAYSINPVFGRVGLFLVGADGLNEYAVKFGFNAEIPFELKNEKPVFVYPDTAFAIAEVACGFNKRTTISPLFGAMISAGISNRGFIFAPTLVDSITDLKSSKNEYTRKSVLWRMPIQKETAAEMALLMKKVAKYGTARKSFRYIKQSSRFKEFDYGGKTGNVSKENVGRVDWFIGFCRHKSDKKQHVAIGVVTVHDEFWTVHSSFLGAEIMRKHIRNIQIAKKKAVKKKVVSTVEADKSVSDSVKGL